MKLIIIGLTTAAISFISIFYILSLVNTQTVITEVNSLTEVRLLIKECKGIHKITPILINNNPVAWIVKCRS